MKDVIFLLQKHVYPVHICTGYYNSIAAVKAKNFDLLTKLRVL